MNERLSEEKKTKQKTFQPVNRVHQRGTALIALSASQYLRNLNQMRASCQETL